MDQLGRSGECGDRLSRRGGGGGDRHRAPEMGRAAAAGGGAQGGQRRDRACDHGASGGRGGEMVAAGCGGVRRQPAAHRDGQAAEDGVAGAVQGLSAGGLKDWGSPLVAPSPEGRGGGGLAGEGTWRYPMYLPTPSASLPGRGAGLLRTESANHGGTAGDQR
eukprot:TRINITY_DN23774_c0_g1_i1.p5 TRINITY_DN23774_c0_g1~~TRINITY_DN23774_c0_g1_i1.p5  ORF type:complete len:162 (-),score=10.11 TRINITY_DN23774_c0_g1_i1:209-694(-)